MFCVNCGNKLEEEWKICPECGTEVIKQKEEQKIGTQGKRVCEKCGNELQDDWVKCPFCGHTEQEENLQQDVKQNSSIKEFEFEGFRRTGRFGFQYITSNIKVDGEHINVVVHKKKEQNITFTRQNILDIKFPILPVIGAMDIVRIILFIILAIPLRGMSIFAVLFFAKITLVKHMQIKLRDGRKIAVPIRQKAESVEFLENIAYPESEILKIAASAVSSSRIMIAEWIISTLMLVLAVASIAIGVQNYKENYNNSSKNSLKDDVVEEDNENITNESTETDDGWKEAYKKYIEQNGNERSTYGLIYVNDDDIPELIMEYGDTVGGVDLCTYYNEKMNVEHVAMCSISYKQKENLILTSGGRMDWYFDTTYEIQEGCFVEVDKGEYGAEDNANVMLDMNGDPIYQYYWNGKEIPKSEYEEKMQLWDYAYADYDVPAMRDFYETTKILINPINVVSIRDYVHQAGYWGINNQYSLFFDSLEGEQLHIRITKDNYLLAEGDIKITDSYSAIYDGENGYFEIKFSDDNNHMEVTGYFEEYNLTDTYDAIWG